MLRVRPCWLNNVFQCLEHNKLSSFELIIVRGTVSNTARVCAEREYEYDSCIVSPACGEVVERMSFLFLVLLKRNKFQSQLKPIAFDLRQAS